MGTPLLDRPLFRPSVSLYQAYRRRPSPNGARPPRDRPDIPSLIPSCPPLRHVRVDHLQRPLHQPRVPCLQPPNPTVRQPAPRIPPPRQPQRCSLPRHRSDIPSPLPSFPPPRQVRLHHLQRPLHQPRVIGLQPPYATVRQLEPPILPPHQPQRCFASKQQTRHPVTNPVLPAAPPCTPPPPPTPAPPAARPLPPTTESDRPSV